MKINLGSNKYLLKEFINIDKEKFEGVDLICDIKDGLPYEDNSIEEIYAGHFIEHLTIRNAIKVLEDCKRVLKPNGIITITIPDFEKILEQFDFEEANKMIVANYEDMPSICPNKIGNLSDNHLSIWNEKYLIQILKKIGFNNITALSVEECPHLVAKVLWQSIVKATK